MIRIEDFGEVVYGTLVTLTDWWDNKRIAEGTISTKDVLKKASFYTYLGVGLAAILMNTFGWAREWDRWTENLSHGFLYDLPRQAYNLYKTTGAAGRGGSASDAIREAQRILQERAAQNQRALTSSRETQRTYQPEMQKASAF